MVETERITRKRLDEWATDLEKHHGTPVLMIGVGHDHTSGEVHIYVPKNSSGAFLEALLEGVLERIRAGKNLPGGHDPGDDD